MDEIIWVEVLSRHRDVQARYRCAGPEVRVGRAYDNDVVVDDPYVAARHLRIRRDAAGALVAEDLGSANGTFSDRGKARQDRILLDGDRPIRIGQTHLRVRAASHAVPRERPQTSHFPAWPIPAALALAIIGMSAVAQWLGETGEAKLYAYLTPELALAFLVVVWTAGWAVMSRIFSGHAHFEHHLLIALAGVLIYLLYGEALAVGAYALSSPRPQAYRYVGTASLLAGVCFLHLRAIGPTRLWLKGGVVGALLAIAIATQALSQSERRSGNSQQDYVQHLMPPSLRLAPMRSADAFLAQTMELKPALDRDRSADPPSGGIGIGAFFDD